MGVYRLAVCEDDEAILTQLHAYCHEILTEDNIEHRIEDFHSARELEQALLAEDKPFDLLLLDIRMEGMTGMELARSLRQRGDRVSVIFVSGYDEYLPQGYSVQPIHFLLKPVSREALAEALRTDWKLNHRPRTAAHGLEAESQAQNRCSEDGRQNGASFAGGYPLRGEL